MTYRTRTIIVLLAVMATAALWPADAAAQRRGYRAGPHVSTVIVARPYYGYGYGYYDPFFWGYGGWYPYGAYAPSYQPYYESVGSARIQVTPKNAEVYVDGYLVGTVNDFDGFLQRLDVPAGEHELTFYLDGYQTIHQKVLFRPGATLKITYAMAPLGPGATGEPRPRPAQGSAPPSRRYAEPAPDQEREAPPSRFGTVAIRVQPADATILVDGEEWTGPEGQGPLLIELGEGSHEVEVRKPGFVTYKTTVRVRAGATAAVNVSLSR